MEKKKYLAPDAKIVLIGPELMQGTEVITTSPTGADQEGKSVEDVVQDEDPELAAPIKDKWEDLSEKKIAK